MSYKLEKPCTDIQRADFIVLHNHNNNLKIEETEQAIFALETNEILDNGTVKINPNYQTQLIQNKETQFREEFFETSLGWIKRKVTMKNGSKKDFLADLLLPIKAGLELGQSVEIITYQKPDFAEVINENYMITLQMKQQATLQFIQECLNQIVSDFNREE